MVNNTNTVILVTVQIEMQLKVIEKAEPVMLQSELKIYFGAQARIYFILTENLCAHVFAHSRFFPALFCLLVFLA